MENKTFIQIWAELDRGRRQQIVRQLIAEGYALSYTTILNWGTGRTQPRAYAMRAGVAKVVGSCLNFSADADTLFPLN